MAQSSESSAQVRLLVAGPIGSSPSGESVTLRRNDFPEWLEKRGFELEVPLGESLGGAGAVKIVVDKLRALTLKEVVKASPLFQDLLKIASDVRDPKQALDAVTSLVGDGSLTSKIAELGGLEKPSGQATEATSVDDVFEAAAVPTEKAAAKSAIDAFLKKGPKSPRTTRASKASRKIRDAIEEAVYLEARRALETDAVASLEASLRGLWLLVSQCPTASGVVVEVLDVDADGVIEAIEARPSGELEDEPDAILIPTPCRDGKTLTALAELGESLMCPVIVDVAPEVLEFEDLETLATDIENLEPQKAAAAWLAVRQEESSRWLCGVANGLVLVAEGTGVARRELVGPGAWAVGAILAKSYAATGSFARITGRPGALQGPAVRTLASGRHEGMATPTEIFIPIRGQAAFAKHGMVALGSSRNSDLVVLAQTPMVRASADAVPLPAQLLTGRIVRFATWVRDQLPAGCDADTARSIFQEASKVFLFPGMTDVGEVDATIKEDDDGVRSLMVYANISPLHAGIPFEIAFPLPMS